MGGNHGGYITATIDDDIVLSSRSLMFKLRFQSTQVGVALGEHGLYEIRLNTEVTLRNVDFTPLRVRVEDGKFYVIDWRSRVIAGDNKIAVFKQKANTTYTLTALLFARGIYCRLSSDGLPSNGIEISVADHKRYISGFPSFGLRSNPVAAGGTATVKDWLVTPVGPFKAELGAIGDSLTAGHGNPEEASYVYVVTREIGQVYTLNKGNFGGNVGGPTTAMDLKRFSFEIAPFKPAIVWIESGTNDLGADVPADEIYQNILAEIALIDWGGIPLLSTVPPRNAYTALQHHQRVKLNELIRHSGYSFVDRDRLLTVPGEQGKLNPTYDFGDGTHLNAEGNQHVAGEALKIISKLQR